MKDKEKCKLMYSLKYKWMVISAKIDQIFQGNLNTNMELPWTKKQKFPLFNQTSCQEQQQQQQQQQRISSAWPCRFAAGKKWG